MKNEEEGGLILDQKKLCEQMLKNDQGNGVRITISSLIIKKDYSGMKIDGKGISLGEGVLKIPWMFINGLTIVESSCNACGSSFEDVKRHSEHNYNLCVKCGKESDDLIGD